MPLTMTPERFEEIRRLVREQQIAREAAEIVAATVDWSKPFADVDAFLAHLDNLPASMDRPTRSKKLR